MTVFVSASTQAAFLFRALESGVEVTGDDGDLEPVPPTDHDRTSEPGPDAGPETPLKQTVPVAQTLLCTTQKDALLLHR